MTHTALCRPRRRVKGQHKIGSIKRCLMPHIIFQGLDSLNFFCIARGEIHSRVSQINSDSIMSQGNGTDQKNKTLSTLLVIDQYVCLLVD